MRRSNATRAHRRTRRAPPSEGRNKEIVLADFEAWKAGTGSLYGLLADDAQWTIVGHPLPSKMYPSREAFLIEVIRPPILTQGS